MRTFSAFRLSPSVTANVAETLYHRLTAHAQAHGTSRSNTIRLALLHYNFDQPPAGLPTEFTNYRGTPCRTVSVSIKSDGLRREYETYTKAHNMSMTQLVAQACYDYTAAHFRPSQD